jgi:large subunit ribosomal protein L13Ae
LRVLFAFLLTPRKVIVIDGRDHLVGRLASVIAKNLLQVAAFSPWVWLVRSMGAVQGKKIVVVRCEELVISGDIYRSQRKASGCLRVHCCAEHSPQAMQFRRKRTLTNPKKGEKQPGND